MEQAGRTRAADPGHECPGRSGPIEPGTRQPPDGHGGGPVPFQRVVEQYGVTVLRVCRALVGPVDADDAWSETFLAALRAYPGLPAGRSIEAWLVTIARRKCVDLLRSRARRAVPVAEAPTARSTLGLPGADDDYAPLWHALARLPEVQRHAVVCHHLLGMPYAEAAEVIGNSPAAARRAGSDGIAALRRALAPAGGAAPDGAHAPPPAQAAQGPPGRQPAPSLAEPSPAAPRTARSARGGTR